ncbi:hypothetical protein ACFX11_003051 [Malus domestica]
MIKISWFPTFLWTLLLCPFFSFAFYIVLQRLVARKGARARTWWLVVLMLQAQDCKSVANQSFTGRATNFHGTCAPSLDVPI